MSKPTNKSLSFDDLAIMIKPLIDNQVKGFETVNFFVVQAIQIL